MPLSETSTEGSRSEEAAAALIERLGKEAVVTGNRRLCVDKCLRNKEECCLGMVKLVGVKS